MDELRLVANTVKHAEGISAEKLRNIRPQLFQHPTVTQYVVVRVAGRSHHRGILQLAMRSIGEPDGRNKKYELDSIHAYLYCPCTV